MASDSADRTAEEMVGVAEDVTSADPTTDAPDDDLVGEPVSVGDVATGDSPAAEETGDTAGEAAEDETPDWAELAEIDPRSPGELLAELTEAEARRDEYLEDVRRARAEFENYRKRMLREGTAQRDQGRADVVGRLLDVLDDFERTVEASEKSEDDGLSKGVQLVHGKLVGVLRDLGVQRIDDVGVPFDPNRHDAVQQVETEDTVDEPRVAQVLRPGYELDGRVLRAAMVVVEQ